jgi:hypothetical protein
MCVCVYLFVCVYVDGYAFMSYTVCAYMHTCIYIYIYIYIGYISGRWICS